MSIFNAYAPVGGAIKTATKTGTGQAVILFTGLAKEPAWFVCVETVENNGSAVAMICTIIYDGATTRAYQVGSAGYMEDMSPYVSFVYSIGSLTIKTSTNYFGYGSYKLYYL